jgi:tRNA 2-thiouridine synthesizing protein A
MMLAHSRCIGHLQGRGYNVSACLNQDANIMTKTVLDLTGLKCPLPALRTRKALLRLLPGASLEVHCTDPMAVIDIPAMVQQLGDHVESSECRNETMIFIIAKRNRAIGIRD